ncbi:protein kinase (macronuclear) [Tetrahymena thermophila SB210]|uniref:Protein kinase n=1 Tax=Tetrahymena thermophila (strain SB210) TaxID=312017 RepID=I7M6A0_TETTS|nr:protein kinase [Tetrahymena thermophila SB210]EAR84823.3 protein kinase [Tetrahymena thermophila SB210]|eukprot:XP_001032486.3 protein kinase [Tetrahymena thermophila SB210]
MKTYLQLNRHLVSQIINYANLDDIEINNNDKTTTSTNYVFIMIFMILALGYLIILILILYRGKTLYNRSTTIIVSKIFYFQGFVLCAFRVISSVLLIIVSYNYDYTTEETNNTQQDNNIQKLLYNGLYISDAVFDMMYFSLFWYIIIYSYKSHVRVGNILEDRKNPAASNKGLNIYTLITVLYSLVHLLITCLYNLDLQNLNQQFYISCISVSDILCIVYYIIGIFILKFKFSGAPYKSSALEKEMKHLERMGYFWLFGRCFQASLDILMVVESQQIQNLIVGKNPNQGIFWNVISYFILPANYIVAEVVPILYSLLQESVKIFIKSPNNSQESVLLVDENDNPVNDPLNNSTDNKDNINEQNSVISDTQDNNIIKINKETQFIKQLKKKEKKRGFGFIQKVLFEKKKKTRESQLKDSFRDSNASGDRVVDDEYDVLAFRILPIDTLSSYILQEVNQDINKLKRYHIKNISKISKLAIDNNQVCLVSKYYELGSLAELIQKHHNVLESSRSSGTSSFPIASDNKSLNKNDQNNNLYGKRLNINSTSVDSFDFKFSYETKMKIAISIAKTMAKLHKIGIIHGHLSSSNILFDTNYEVKISDIGLTSLKKLISYRFGYQNKTHFTAPEHLQEKSLIVQNPKTKSDIYSFAFILWELFMEREAFSNLSLEDLKKTIILDNSRPKIPEVGPIPKEVATIIRYCWLLNPNERPEFGVILANLKRINNESLDDDEDFIFDEQEYKLSFKDVDQIKEQRLKSQDIESDDEDEEMQFKFKKQNQQI